MRKPVEIEKQKCGPLWSTVLQRARMIDIRACVSPTAIGLVMLKGYAKAVAAYAVQEYAVATRELFGKEEYTAEEISAREYLQQFAS